MNAASGQVENLREALGRLSVGVVIVDGQRRVTYMNDAARRALGSDAPITVRDGLLAARRPSDQRRWIRCVGEVTDSHPTASVVIGSDPNEAVCVTVCRLPSSPPADGAVTKAPEAWSAVVVLDPPAEVRAALGPLRQLGLGLAEARLAIALAEGRSLSEYAAGQGVSINTARTHLARIRHKLDCHTQADVVRHVLRLLPRVRLG